MTSPRLTARAAALQGWKRPVTDVRFVDEARAEALAKAGILTVEDLLRHYPFRYLDLTDIVPLGRVKPGQEVTVVGKVHDIKVKKPRPRLTITEVALVDGTGVLVGVWFNQPYMQQRFHIGERVAFSGKASIEYGLRQMRSPFFEKLAEEDAAHPRIVPVHRATEGVSPNWMRRLVLEAVQAYGDVPDFMPASLRQRHGMTALSEALRQVHFPDSMTQASEARRRLAYDEFLLLQLGLAHRRHQIVDERPGVAHRTDGDSVSALRASLPFTLTDDQETALSEVLDDMGSPKPMNRMLLGDVGTGKTIVAGFAMAAAADSGSQAAMMAPTEVLAAQYSLKLGPDLERAGVSCALLTGSTPAPERRRVLAGLKDGSIKAAFGTNALMQKGVQYADLTLAIVDEQHRFGVAQRLALRGKGATADMLVMSATPIPRSLALTIYGDLDTSYLRTRPTGRGAADQVATEVLAPSRRERAYARIREAVGAGHQAYVVCALVEESEAAEARAATREVERLKKFVFPELRMGLLTGRMKPAEKTAVMDSFRAGELDVLVATTVIEVGVDVPNATVMLVEDADRFGLAQLHQLRGRVGRGEAPGEFLLVADPRSDEGRRRLEVIESTSDGFELAEEDLRLRGEGQMLGERQHGLPELRLASVLSDRDLLEEARTDAQALTLEDPHLDRPEHGPLKREVMRAFGREWDWLSSG